MDASRADCGRAGEARVRLTVSSSVASCRTVSFDYRVHGSLRTDLCANLASKIRVERDYSTLSTVLELDARFHL